MLKLFFSCVLKLALSSTPAFQECFSINWKEGWGTAPKAFCPPYPSTFLHFSGNLGSQMPSCTGYVPPTTTSGCLAELPSLLHWQLLSLLELLHAPVAAWLCYFWSVWATTFTWMLFAFDPHSLALGHFLVFCRSTDLSLGFLGSSCNARNTPAVTTSML